MINEQLNNNGKRRGRPKIEIDFNLVKSLAAIHCTQEEIAGVLGVSVDTLQRNKGFCSIYKKGIETAKVSLRRTQWLSADRGNVSMLIWLGKQYLDQKDTQRIEATGAGGKPFATFIIRMPDGSLVNSVELAGINGRDSN